MMLNAFKILVASFVAFFQEVYYLVKLPAYAPVPVRVSEPMRRVIRR
jgi:hypothetical protein